MLCGVVVDQVGAKGTDKRSKDFIKMCDEEVAALVIDNGSGMVKVSKFHGFFCDFFFFF